MTEQTAHGIDRVRAALDAAGVAYDVIEHPPVYSAVDEARAAGGEPPDTAKTLVLHDGERRHVAVVPAGRRLDLDRLREVLHASRHLRLATEDELARDFPGFDVGALPPFGLEPVPEVMDIRLVYRERVLCAGGDHRHGVRLDPRDLLRLAEPRVADICVHDPGDHRFADVPRV
jgi:prolyl-tRNA editing enzyme YbaK/EbsC (Cys-tRNA(Pro) deacylase)